MHDQRENRPVPGSPQEHETVLDEVAERLGFRDFIRRRPWMNVAYRATVGVVGTLVVIIGFGLIPLPGPGWLIVFAGLAILATEFEWAERLLHYGRDRFRAWTRWVRAQSLAVRGLIGAGGLVVIAGCAALYLSWKGVPSWVPVIG